ncbi:MarR family winged helix-turn-helix transcriptional regulator [Mangrovihabitans endophyticus]|uniref:MarR family transcriptional regulator n=1 Tax=Mangrovihabitans endophyticus TaxID=1751298 RepID=A0A8J3C212_9ACTN|nr:MarR family transcriptional regulator [Mangrovihabitans endophyticus]GGK97892.1 MarR family transcriptional regulator [Mangrovihabitans endophyticus]
MISAEDAAVAATLERLFEALRRMTPRGELSLTAVSTLRRLERSGPHRLSELHAAEGVTQPAMTQLVTRLEKEGLATRGADPHDGRAVVVTITDAGRAAVARRRTGRAQALSRLLSQLPEAERAAVCAVLPALDHLSSLVAEQPPNT